MNEPTGLVRFTVCAVCSAMIPASALEAHVCSSLRAQGSGVMCTIEMPTLLHTHQEMEIRGALTEPPVRAITATTTTIVPGTGSLALPGYAPTTNTTIVPPAGSLTLPGYLPTVRTTS